MLEKPDISEQELVDTLQEAYGLTGINLEFLPIGNDVNSAMYRLTADGQKDLYLKLRKTDFNMASVLVPFLLREHNVEHVIAPIPTKDRLEWTPFHEYSIALYPFIEGRNGFQQPLIDSQWVALGRAVKGLHTLHVPDEVAQHIPHEKYSPTHRDAVKNLMQKLDSTDFADESARQLAEFMQQKEKEIIHMVGRADELSSVLQEQKNDFVLCHADLHAGNIFLDKDSFYIIDWDTLIFAPKERDLMFVGGGVAGVWNRKEEEVLFYSGYGDTTINSDALHYYRYERIVEDIEEYATRIIFSSEGGKDREKGVEQLKHAFAPNNVVEIAMSEEKP